MNSHPGGRTLASSRWSERHGTRTGGVVWLPGSLAQSVIRDRFPVRLPSLSRWAERRRSERVAPKNLVAKWREMLESGEVTSRAELARRVGVSRARVTQALGPVID